jgi:hypothetical protein
MKLNLKFGKVKRLMMGLRASSHRSQVPSLTYASKSQNGGKVSTCGSQVTTKVWLVIIKAKSWLFLCKYVCSLGWKLGLAFCSTQLTTQVPSLTSEKMMPCRHPCHSWDLGLGTPCEVLSSNFHALNNWNCTDWPQVTWNLGLGTQCELAPNTTLNVVCSVSYSICLAQY